MGGGDRGKRESYAVRREGAPSITPVSGEGQRPLLPKAGTQKQTYNLAGPPIKDPPHAVFLGWQQQTLQQKLDKEAAKIAAESVIQVLGTIMPFLGALYLIYKIATFVYPVAKAGVVTYSKTTDMDAAYESMAKEFARQAIKAATGAFVRQEVASTMANSSLDIKIGDMFYEAVNAVADNTIEEVIDEATSNDGA